MFPTELVDMVKGFLEPFERFRLALRTDAEREYIYVKFATERRWRFLRIDFIWSQGCAVFEGRRYTYEGLIACLEREAHRTMHTSPHPYVLRHKRRASRPAVPSVTCWQFNGTVVMYSVGAPDLRDAFTHSVYFKRPVPDNAVYPVPHAADIRTKLAQIFSAKHDGRLLCSRDQCVTSTRGTNSCPNGREGARNCNASK